MPASAKRILIAPLDWGLGHTTRCVPVIRQLQELGHEVLFAGDERQQAFIRQRFTRIDSIFFEGYRVRYSRRALMFTLLWQLPRLLNTIRREHAWLRDIVARERIDGIISDNRYGLWHPQKPCVIMTHQLGVYTGLGSRADLSVREIHYRYLNRFREVWVPDMPGTENLAGELSHPDRLPAHVRYIGSLSQFSGRAKPASEGKHLLILLSGPEPQRSILADILWAQAMRLDRPIVFVEGKEGAKRQVIPPHIRHISLGDEATLAPLFAEASLVVCRSGYSTVMDLAMFGKPAVLIPTPGQTEQEYLARTLAAAGVFYSMEQSDASLQHAIELSESGHKTGIYSPHTEEDLLASAIDQWIAKL
jgi:UDP:flavonoid glycosyltransferase YjiC (YdhE family)